MEFKGTKGKWISRYNGSYWEVNREEDFEDGKRLAVSVMVFNIEDGNCVFDVSHEDKANAQLIATAPEMFGKLKEFLDLFAEYDMRPEDELHEYAESVREILDKALGYPDGKTD